jgi:hypothetical protein
LQPKGDNGNQIEALQNNLYNSQPSIPQAQSEQSAPPDELDCAESEGKFKLFSPKSGGKHKKGQSSKHKVNVD